MSTIRTNIINVLDDYFSPKATDYIAPALVMGAGTAGLSMLGDESNQEVISNTIGGMGATALAMYLGNKLDKHRIVSKFLLDNGDNELTQIASKTANDLLPDKLYNTVTKYVDSEGNIIPTTVIELEGNPHTFGTNMMELQNDSNMYRNMLKTTGFLTAVPATIATSYLYEPNTNQVIQQTQPVTGQTVIPQQVQSQPNAVYG